MECKKSLHLVNQLLRLIRYGLVGWVLVCLPLALSAATANVSIVNFAFAS